MPLRRSGYRQLVTLPMSTDRRKKAHEDVEKAKTADVRTIRLLKRLWLRICFLDLIITSTLQVFLVEERGEPSLHRDTTQHNRFFAPAGSFTPNM